MKTYLIEPEAESKIAQWLATRNGVAVWTCKDLSSPRIGSETFTPALDADGNPSTSPHWSNGKSADEIVTDPARFAVRSWSDVARVKVRRGPPYLGGIHRRDREKLDNALANAGEGSAWRPDYDSCKYGSPWFDAVVMKPSETRPLRTESTAKSEG